MKTCLIVFNLFVLFPHLSKIVAFNNGVDYGWTIHQQSKDYKSSLPAVAPKYPGGDLSIGFTHEGEDTHMLIDITCNDLLKQISLRGMFSGIRPADCFNEPRSRIQVCTAAGNLLVGNSPRASQSCMLRFFSTHIAAGDFDPTGDVLPQLQALDNRRPYSLDHEEMTERIAFALSAGGPGLPCCLCPPS
jgi:hypothetical protein